MFEYSPFVPASANAKVRVESSTGKIAMLITGHEIQEKISKQEGRFKEYIEKHHKSWLEFANTRHSLNIKLKDLMLVYGYHMTVDFDMFTFSNVEGEFQIALGAGFPGMASGSLAFTKGSSQMVSPSVNSGPHKQGSSSSTDVSEIEDVPALKDPSANFKQCVFLKRYRIKRWAGWGPKYVTSRGMAGSHNVGSGNRVGGDEMDACIEDGGVDPTDPLLEYILSVSLQCHNGLVSMIDQTMC